VVVSSIFTLFSFAKRRIRCMDTGNNLLLNPLVA